MKVASERSVTDAPRRRPVPTRMTERRHVNGVVARVSYFAICDLYQASCYRSDSPDETFAAEISIGPYAKAIARSAADQLAHPDCDGVGCEPWPVICKDND
jgi:hypothetical protein